MNCMLRMNMILSNIRLDLSTTPLMSMNLNSEFFYLKFVLFGQIGIWNFNFIRTKTYDWGSRELFEANHDSSLVTNVDKQTHSDDDEQIYVGFRMYVKDSQNVRIGVFLSIALERQAETFYFQEIKECVFNVVMYRYFDISVFLSPS